MIGSNLHPDDHLSFPLEEAQMAATLRSIAQEVQAKPGFQTELEEILMKSANQHVNQPVRPASNWKRVFAWSALAVILFISFSWAHSHLIPRGLQPATSSEIPQETTTTKATKAIGMLTPTTIPTPQLPSPTPPGMVYALLIQPETDFVLQADFPASPAEATIFRQAEWEKLTIENARAAAEKLGVKGEIYTVPYGPPGMQSFRAQDGERNVTFYNSPTSFQYEAGNSTGLEEQTCIPPCLPTEANGAFLKLLNDHNLLDFPATSQLSLIQPQVEQLVQLIDGQPLIYEPPTYQGEALISSKGEVLRLDFNPIKIEAARTLPILTAEQAWEQAVGSKLINGVGLNEQIAGAQSFHTWRRNYPIDQRIELFGYISSFPAIEAGKPPLILIDGYPASGNIQGMAEIDRSNPFVQVWGSFQDDQQGGRLLQVLGWQISPFPSQVLTGTLQIQGDQAYVDTNGRILRLPDRPVDLPEDKALMFSGVVLEQPEPTLEWYSISTGFGGGGGGGGGGANWAEIYLEGDTNPLPTSEPTIAPPNLTGQRLEGVQGKPIVFIHKYSDNSTQVEVLFYTDPGQGGLEQSTVYLEGAGLAGIEAYHNLPVRIWGVISESSARSHKVSVERVEPVYPGISVQAWLGKFEIITLEGREVLLFTNADGQQSVLNSSIETPGLDNGNAPGDPVVVEGILIPNKSFGGYPVIVDYAVNAASGMQSLNDYQSMSLEPVIIQKPGKAGSRRIAVVTKIELAYYANEPRHLYHRTRMTQPFVQPVWRFSGKYDDGAYFELIVQALDPMYLKQP